MSFLKRHKYIYISKSLKRSTTTTIAFLHPYKRTIGVVHFLYMFILNSMEGISSDAFDWFIIMFSSCQPWSYRLRSYYHIQAVARPSLAVGGLSNIGRPAWQRQMKAWKPKWHKNNTTWDEELSDVSELAKIAWRSGGPLHSMRSSGLCR